jgi:BirA family transcriptional regulator, biotin operon repressor / biotin---[acetyl-CoA-carboxylase] ligase
MSEKIENLLIKLDCIDSTNNYATNQLFKQGWEEGTVVVANEQLKGKGQQRNSWESEKGKNLLFSIVLYPRFIPVQNQFIISKVIALGVCEAVSLFVENVSIKWPNDIYVENKKIAGILIENAIMGSELSYSVAGVGLNVNQQKFLSDAPNPVSLSQLKEIEFDREAILSLVLQSINKWYSILKENNFSAIDTAYLNRFYRFGVSSKYEDVNGVFTGTIVGVDPIGQLMIEKGSGEIRSYYFKEVAFLG